MKPCALYTDVTDPAEAERRDRRVWQATLVTDMVDAALVGLDQGELVTIPGLHDGDEWTRFEAARRALSQRFGNSVPAARYGIGVRASA
jgi:short-subunit dehydrogenase